MPQYASYSVLRFMRAMMERGEVTLTMRSRPEVATRRWYVLTWQGQDKQAHTVVASDDQLLMRRATAVEDRIEKQLSGEWEE